MKNVEIFKGYEYFCSIWVLGNWQRPTHKYEGGANNLVSFKPCRAQFSIFTLSIKSAIRFSEHPGRGTSVWSTETNDVMPRMFSRKRSALSAVTQPQSADSSTASVQKRHLPIISQASEEAGGLANESRSQSSKPQEQEVKHHLEWRWAMSGQVKQSDDILERSWWSVLLDITRALGPVLPVTARCWFC